jgi:release factor glutamine methyltransferase
VERQLFNRNEAVSFGELIAVGEKALAGSSPSARLDAELLMGHASGFSRSSLLARLPDACSDAVRDQFLTFLARREKGEPVAYITGHKEFWDLDFTVNSSVLIPRPESELVVEEALKACLGVKEPKLADLGTGSGCLVISIAHALHERSQKPRCTAVDISQGALTVARANAVKHKVAESIDFRQSDWFSAANVFIPPYDVIVANPPYIDPTEALPRDVGFEPRSALFSEDQGLSDTYAIIEQAASMLRVGGVLLIEVGAGKRKLLKEWFSQHAVPYAHEFLGDDRECDSFTVVKLVR